MKKILLFVLVVVFTLSVNAQISYNLGFSFTNFERTNQEFIKMKPAVDAYLELGYLFNNNYGINTGAHSNYRYFDFENEIILSSNVQIPLLLSKTQKINNTSFGVTSTMGYILTVPLKTTTTQNISYDIGLIHGLYTRYTVDLLLNKKKFYSGVDLAYDFYNENNIKFFEIGIVIGVNLYF